MPGETSFISRFTLKFVEIVAAGVATAVSGYVVAHLGGFFPAPAPMAVQVPTLQAAPSVNAAAGNPNAQPATAVSIDADARRLAPQPDLKPAAIAPTRATADVAPVRKPLAAEASAPEAKPHEAAETKPRETAETKPHETAETKPRSTESLEAQVRAALAKAESAKPVPVAPSHQAAVPVEAPRAPPAVEMQPRQADTATGAIPVTPRSADAVPQQAPVFVEPPASVESLPVAGVNAAPEPPAQQAQAEAQPSGNDFFSAFKLPDFLSPDSHSQVPADRAPRPPMPVGQ